MIPHRPLSASLRPLACMVAGCYLSLALLIFFCGSSHTHNTGHHASPTHSMLCAWACQGSNFTTLISLPSPLVPFTPIISNSKDWGSAYHSYVRIGSYSRGPPLAALC